MPVMNGAELRQWRENHKLTQAQFAEHLKWTRDMVANRENGRVECPEGLESTLDVLASLLSKQVVAPEKNEPRRRGLPSQVILNLAGVRVTPEYATRQTFGQGYWKYDWVDPANGHHMFNLYVVGRDWDGSIKGLCRTLCLDANTWHVRAEVCPDEPATKRLAIELDNRLATARLNAPQSLAETIKPNPRKDDVDVSAKTPQ